MCGDYLFSNSFYNIKLPFKGRCWGLFLLLILTTHGMHASQLSFWSNTKPSRCLLSLKHLAGLSCLGKSLQTGQSEGHISFQLKAELWVDDLLWDPSFSIGTLWNGKLGDLHLSGTRTRSQEVNYRPKLFHQLARLRNSNPVQVELHSLTKGNQVSWHRSCPVFAYNDTIFPGGRWALGENTFWFLLG